MKPNRECSKDAYNQYQRNKQETEKVFAVELWMML